MAESGWRATPRNPLVGAWSDLINRIGESNVYKDLERATLPDVLGIKSGAEEVDRWATGNSPFEVKAEGPRIPSFKRDRAVPVLDATGVAPTAKALSLALKAAGPASAMLGVIKPKGGQFLNKPTPFFQDKDHPLTEDLNRAYRNWAYKHAGSVDDPIKDEMVAASGKTWGTLGDKLTRKINPLPKGEHVPYTPQNSEAYAADMAARRKSKIYKETGDDTGYTRDGDYITFHSPEHNVSTYNKLRVKSNPSIEEHLAKALRGEQVPDKYFFEPLGRGALTGMGAMNSDPVNFMKKFRGLGAKTPANRMPEPFEVPVVADNQYPIHDPYPEGLRGSERMDFEHLVKERLPKWSEQKRVNPLQAEGEARVKAEKEAAFENLKWTGTASMPNLPPEGKYNWVELTSPEQWVKESRMMSNCTKGYCPPDIKSKIDKSSGIPEGEYEGLGAMNNYAKIRAYSLRNTDTANPSVTVHTVDDGMGYEKFREVEGVKASKLNEEQQKELIRLIRSRPNFRYNNQGAELSGVFEDPLTRELYTRSQMLKKLELPNDTSNSKIKELMRPIRDRGSLPIHPALPPPAQPFGNPQNFGDWIAELDNGP